MRIGKILFLYQEAANAKIPQHLGDADNSKADRVDAYLFRCQHSGQQHRARQLDGDHAPVRAIDRCGWFGGCFSRFHTRTLDAPEADFRARRFILALYTNPNRTK